MADVTLILQSIEKGDPQAAEQLLPLVYDELRKLASERLTREQPGQTLQATALVHETYIRLVDVEYVQRWDSRGHFFTPLQLRPCDEYSLSRRDRSEVYGLEETGTVSTLHLPNQRGRRLSWS